MDINSLAAAALGFAGMCLWFVVRRGRSGNGQAFVCQLGDRVLSGVYKVADGLVGVTCEEGSRYAKLDHEQPVRVAERLLAEIHAEAQARK